MAGTINTTNYNFKKYAPDDTVSMLQTFNGDMDAIDKAIKDREDVETEQGASIAKVEAGLASTNNGLNSANQTISAVQVQVTTNTRNIQTVNTEIDTLDARVQALEDGGSAIETLTLYLESSPLNYYHKLYKQGNHITGTITFSITTITADNLMSVASFDNITGYSKAMNMFKYANLPGNIFGLNPNIGHCIGTSFRRFFENTNLIAATGYPCAVYDGNVTHIVVPLETNMSSILYSITIDTLI